MTSYDEMDTQAISAMEELWAPGPAERLNALLTEEEKAVQDVRPLPPDLSPDQQKLRANFEQDGEVLARQISEEVAALDLKFRNAATTTRKFPSIRSTTVDTTYSPDGPNPYRYAARDVPGFEATGDGAAADIHTGTFWASRYTTSGQLTSRAAIGVTIVPEQSCLLWVRPYINWSGFDILQHVDYMPGSGEQRRAFALAQVGILVSSRDLAGGNPVSVGQTHVDLWSRDELNPVGSRDYSGTAFAGDYQLRVPASSDRMFDVWATCRVYVLAESGFAVATRASSSASCSMPFMFVGQVTG
ncbi:hypothetical protein ABZ934_31740 [Streptomyces sp. NPDC046557]|uniref:hypothetical protein n=1 Tax=Streptomyces sp. NPDC046557 TaxID=3155372 RepID=UPI0033F29AAC